MDILLDNRALVLDGNSANLEGILSNVENNYLDDGRIIWSVRINGNPYSEDTAHEALEIFPTDIDVLEINTKNEKEISLLFLRTGKEMTDTLIQSALKISELFRTNDLKNTHRHYKDFLEAYQYFSQMVQLCINALSPYDEKHFFRDSKITTKIEALEILFNKMISCQEQENWIMLADHLEFEFIPLLKSWQELFPILGNMQ